MLNDALRLIRVYHDMNQADAAARVGLSKSYVSELESGSKKVTLEVMEKYAEGFNIPMSSLMLFAEQAENPSFSDNARVFVADKVVKMLDWIETVTADREERESGRAS